jgi:hypothetical protein
MSDVASTDFFRDDEHVADPYPYELHLEFTLRP